jgi:hypothetical protein
MNFTLLKALVALVPVGMLFCGSAVLLENLALRHQIGVLKRSARKRPRLTSGDRLLWDEK